MISSYQKYELFGETILEKLVLNAPFEVSIPAGPNACFMYLLGGMVILAKDTENQKQMEAQEALLLNCNTFAQKVYNSDVNSKNEVILVHFHPTILKTIYKNGLPSVFQNSESKISNLSHQSFANDFLIQKYIEGLLFYFENPTLVNDDILILKLKEIILLLSQTHNAIAVQKIFSQLFSTTSYTFMQVIEAHMYTDISVEQLAKECNLSLSTFKREFSKQYDATPAHYLKNKRLEKAAEMLLFSNERISDIAYDCGFGDTTNFSKSFFDKYQLSPSQYRLNGFAK